MKGGLHSIEEILILQIAKKESFLKFCLGKKGRREAGIFKNTTVFQ